MFINCPYCSQLVATDPVLDQPPTHCPHCGSLLRRDHNLPDDGPDDAPPLDFNELMKPQAGDTDEGTDPTADARGDNAVDTAATADAAPVPAPVAKPARTGSRRAPSFARGDAPARRDARELPALATAIALALILLLQLLLADRARLAADAKWRPLLGAVCTVLRCDLPPWREPAAFTLLQRDVRQHPTIPGALRVSATFRNDARWSQPWPRLQLTLSDANGRPAGERSFEAREYLGGNPNQAELAHGESATVAMDIMEPAPQIVAYDFKFR